MSPDPATAGRDALVLSHLRLTHAVARRLAATDGGVALLGPEDAAAWGVLGLVRAAEGFDPARGVRFASYAWPAVARAARRAARHAGVVSVKAGSDRKGASAATRAAVRRARRFRYLDDVRFSTASERREFFADYDGRAEASPVEPRALAVEDPGPAAVDGADSAAARAALVDALLAALPPAWAEVVRLHVLGGLTLRDVAARLGCSRQNVEQKYRRAMKKLRTLCQNRGLTRPE